MTWPKVINCVRTELFPVLAIALKKCVDEKLSEDADFKLTDFGDKVVNEILEKLKGKRTMNNKEIEYLRILFKRATDSPMEQRLVIYSFVTSKDVQYTLCINVIFTYFVFLQQRLITPPIH